MSSIYSYDEIYDTEMMRSRGTKEEPNFQARVEIKSGNCNLWKFKGGIKWSETKF